MFSTGNTVLYGTTGVCKIDGTVDREFGSEIKTYYVLKPLAQEKCTVFVPTDNEKLVSKMRKVLSVEEIYDIIKSVPSEADIWDNDDAIRRDRFSSIINAGDRKELMLLIRSLYNKQQERRDDGKRLHMTDEHFMKEAERLLYDEFSAVLNITPEQVLPFITNELEPDKKI